jgi:glycosyltransferase involved in cell wall biosynthesis
LDYEVYLSIIIPAYNEELRLPVSLEQVSTYLNTRSYEAEVLVVENGSQDQTFALAEAFAAERKNFYALHEELPGKGNAVRRGMLAAKGQYRFMCDADLSMPIEELDRFLPPAISSPEIVIASREALGATRIGEPQYRHLGGRLVNEMIRLLALPNLHDTQCGFKLFRADIAEDLFNAQTLTGWSFDVEVLYIARTRGYKIIEIPIPWYYRELSHVKPVRDALKLAIDLFAIHRNARKGSYVKKV